ncbi:MAG TPA: cupin-like domain-containing protein [Steroidobacteraceae bacterium]|nr:cupin-like domain-containing protein [Steroidobacteraceae bacterium]
MAGVAGKIREVPITRPGHLPLGELLASGLPAVLRGLGSEWTLVRKGLDSEHEARRYIASLYNGRPVDFSHGGPEARGRAYYDDQFGALNFKVRRDRLDKVLDEIAEHRDDDPPPMYYVASLPTDDCLPGFRAGNAIDFAEHGVDPPPSIWIGNRTIASCHYDAPNNIACVAVGRRRFTVFPPEQTFNLYPGPLDPTPGGQAVSAVDFANPDFDRFPNFRLALAAGMSAELEPGDAIFVPSMWWHHVEGLSPFNTLVNYWWSSAPDWVPTPMNTLLQAIWTIRDLPEREKRAWRDVFEYYVFGPAERAGAHLPEKSRGVLGPFDENRARQMRAMLINKLNR